ncbi:MAG: adenosine deaminase, partial [Acidobacteria bacterium]
LNSDDPAMFGTSLECEFELAANTFSLSRRQLVGLCENAVRASFLPESERGRLLNELRSAATTA